jgi:hypothetical protein
MKLKFHTHTIFILATSCLLFWSYGVLYSLVPPLREWHNEQFFKLKNDAIRVEATIIRVGSTNGRTARKSAPVLGIRYQVAATTYFGSIVGNDSISASEHGKLATELKGQTLDILIDAQRPGYFYGQTHARAWTQVFESGFFYILIFALTVLSWAQWWKLLKQCRHQKVMQFNLRNFGKNIPKFPAVLSGIIGTVGALFLCYVIAITPLMKSQHTLTAFPLSINESFLGEKWQRWRHIEYRMSGYDSDRQKCDNFATLESFSIHLDIRWRTEEAMLANQQVLATENTTLCKVILSSNQRITLN